MNSRTTGGPLEIANPWTPYGLRSDPFFQEPLTPLEAGPDGDLLVGRHREIARLGSQILGGDSTRAILQGPAGVGKTTVVNALKSVLSRQGVLTHSEPVRIAADTTVRSFAADVLRVLLQVQASTGRAVSGKEREFWRRLGRVVVGEDVTGGSVQVGPIGGGRAPGRISAEVGEGSLHPEMTQAFALLARAGETRTVIHVDNLENLTRAEPRRAVAVLLGLRDHFFIPHSHWVFVGADDVDDAVFRPTPQLGGIVPLVLHLEPLSGPEVVELLERRARRLALPDRAPVVPVEAGATKGLCARYRGDLRNLLRLMSRAAQHRTPLDPVKPMDLRELLSLMAPEYARDLARRLGDSLWKHLTALARDRKHDAEVRQTDLGAATGLAKGPAKAAWDRLVSAGMLWPTRTEGRSRWHRFAGEVTIAVPLV